MATEGEIQNLKKEGRLLLLAAGEKEKEEEEERKEGKEEDRVQAAGCRWAGLRKKEKKETREECW